MSLREELSRRVEEFLDCRTAEEHTSGRVHQLYERPSIMISREAGARGLEIALELVDYLTQFDETAEHGWALFDKSLVTQVIENRKLPDTVREYLTPVETAPPPHEVIDTMHGTPPHEWNLFQHSADAIRRLCRLGNVIILGRGANFLTQDLSNAFHVRLVGDRSGRARAASATLNLPHEEALAFVDATDQARSTYVERHLNRSVSDASAYHLTLNIGRFDPRTSARVVGDTLMEWAGGRALPVSA